MSVHIYTYCELAALTTDSNANKAAVSKQDSRQGVDDDGGVEKNVPSCDLYEYEPDQVGSSILHRSTSSKQRIRIGCRTSGQY